jgi:transcriptional regulator with GAF, ATPase, and Fis domain
MTEFFSQAYVVDDDFRGREAEIAAASNFNANRKAGGAFGEIIGQSGTLRQIIKQIEMVAPTNASVLILGETGTGKELIARELHRRSQRRYKLLVRVNCACIPKELYESEFFGHARGAFTGAVRDRVGRFESAAGGTLFLDEIGEIPLELQTKLLRVLQEKSYERVGEEKTRHADVRIIAATNRDLKKEVAVGRFREDLFYRLNVVPLKVIPLRHRKDDIPLLAEHFVELSVKELRCPRPRLTRAGIDALQNYDWPGNIRELRNVIERASIIAQGGALEFDLPGSDLSFDRISFGLKQVDQVESELVTEAEMRRRERENVFAVLQKTNWKIKGADGAADLLGLKPSTLISRIEKMGLKRSI